MRFGKSVVASVILAVMMIGVSVQAAPDDPWVMKPVEKLGRGIANVAFGPLEILIRGWDVTQELGGIAGVHCENHGIISARLKEVEKKKGNRKYGLFPLLSNSNKSRC